MALTGSCGKKMKESSKTPKNQRAGATPVPFYEEWKRHKNDLEWHSESIWKHWAFLFPGQSDSLTGFLCTYSIKRYLAHPPFVPWWLIIRMVGWWRGVILPMVARAGSFKRSWKMYRRSKRLQVGFANSRCKFVHSNAGLGVVWREVGWC